MMPPPRRFSAAPMLTCPHRTKSSSLSSSSLHHAYSIDSSESMITVIPASRGAFGLASDFAKRSSRGSISCLSSAGQQLQSPGAGQTSPSMLNLAAEQQQSVGLSHYAIARSPMSPRSPSRLSPGILTPSGACETYASFSISGQTGASSSASAAALEPPFSPANTSCTTTYSSNTALTVVQQQQQQQTMRWIFENSQQQDQQQQQQSSTSDLYESVQQQQARLFMRSSASSGGFQFNCGSLSGAGAGIQPLRKPQLLQQFEDDSSLAVENGTSFNSSRNELDEFASLADQQEDERHDVSPPVELNFEDRSNVDFTHQQQQSSGLKSPAPSETQNYQLSQHRGSTLATTFDVNTTIDPNQPIVCETINDFCARHSREELEYLVSQIEGLRISECYFSQRSNTLCMIIEIFHKGESAS